MTLDPKRLALARKKFGGVMGADLVAEGDATKAAPSRRSPSETVTDDDLDTAIDEELADALEWAKKASEKE